MWKKILNLFLLHHNQGLCVLLMPSVCCKKLDATMKVQLCFLTNWVWNTPNHTLKFTSPYMVFYNNLLICFDISSHRISSLDFQDNKWNKNKSCYQFSVLIIIKDRPFIQIVVHIPTMNWNFSDGGINLDVAVYLRGSIYIILHYICPNNS